MLYQLWSHTLGARSIYWVHIFPCSEMMWSLYEINHICDLSRKNVPYGIRSNGWTHGKRTDKKRVQKPFKTVTLNSWTAEDNLWTDEVERLNGCGKFLNGWGRTDERLRKILERMRTNGWTAAKNFWTDEVDRMNGCWKVLNGWGRTADEKVWTAEIEWLNGWGKVLSGKSRKAIKWM